MHYRHSPKSFKPINFSTSHFVKVIMIEIHIHHKNLLSNSPNKFTTKASINAHKFEKKDEITNINRRR